MTWLNEWEIDNALDRYAEHPVLGPAVLTLDALRKMTSRTSDGWHIWPRPGKAAAKLMDLIHDASWPERDSRYVEPTPAALRKALAPVKAFRTRMTKTSNTWFDFAITERLPTKRERLTIERVRAQQAAISAEAEAKRWHREADRLTAELAGLVDT